MSQGGMDSEAPPFASYGRAVRMNTVQRSGRPAFPGRMATIDCRLKEWERPAFEESKAAAGFEPAIEDLQSRALATWLCRHVRGRETGLEPATLTLAR